MEGMRVLMILEGEFPTDERVEKEALTLIEAGFDVDIFALSFSKKDLYQNYRGISVYSPYIPKIIYKFSPAILVFPLYYWFRHWQISEIVKTKSYSYIHVHDLPMSKLGYRLSRKYGGKFICDQHEFYSNWIGRTAHMQTLLGKIIGWSGNWSKFERKFLRKADLVITVSQNLRALYIDLYDIDEDKIISVPNTPLKKEVSRFVINNEIVEKYQDRFVIFYGGMIDILRGIDLVIKSIPYVLHDIPDILILLAGRIRRNCDPVKLASELGVTKHVEYVGFLKPEDLMSYMAASKICFAASPADSLEVNNSISTKIYQYLYARKPVLVGRARMMRDFVLKYNLGLSADEKDPIDIAKTIIKMKNQLSGFSFEVPEEEIYWEHTSKEMVIKYLEL
jgi:glycosyltransferase involved in cell wall biosynthesis